MSDDAAQRAVATLRAAFDEFADADLGALATPELLALMDEVETLSCQLPGLAGRLLAHLQADTAPRELGAASWRDVLATRWRLSAGEASRRVADAAVLGPRRTLTGEPLAPSLPAVAAARDTGAITTEHVRVLRDAMADLPGWIDADSRSRFEVDLVRLATGVSPKPLKDAAARRLFLLDQDGPVPDDAERARQRGLRVGRQGCDGMIEVSGRLTPEAWATWEAIFAKYAAPGMCDADHEPPCSAGTPTQEQVDADARTLAQRRHDALVAIGRIALTSGELGTHNGLPVTLVIRTTLADLESRAGSGVSGGGTALPIGDVIRLAGHANHYLAVFDGATGAALNLFRARRTASPAQRIMLIARDGGCSKPCCTVGAYGAQVHHAVADWRDGGQTNVDENTLACGPHNRLVDRRNGGWTTRINARGECEWIPPPHLDTGQARVNYHHRPDALWRSPDGEPLVGRPPDRSRRMATRRQDDDDHDPGGEAA